MTGWHDNSFLSDDGEYLTVGYVGDNLLDRDFTASLPLDLRRDDGRPHQDRIHQEDPLSREGAT